MKTFKTHLFHILLLTCLLATLSLPASRAQAQSTIIYVNQSAAGNYDGTSWTDAYTDLQSALTAATSGEEVWVAAGTYKPTAGADRIATFQLKNGVALYGGFAPDVMGGAVSVTCRH